MPASTLPAFPTAQLAAIYGIQEWVTVHQMSYGDTTPIVYEPVGCTHPVCLTGGAVTMGSRAAFGQFAEVSTGGGAACFAYVFQDGAAWRSMDAICSQNLVQPVRGQQDFVQVSGGGCAGVHQTPAVTGTIVGCLGNGTAVQVDDGPDYVANGAGQLGFLWWHLAGLGWMEHEFLLFTDGAPCVEPQCALDSASCPSGYTPAAALTGGHEFSSTTVYDNIALPPLTQQQPNNAVGFRASMVCGGGTMPEVTAFMETQLEAHGFHFVDATSCRVGSYQLYQCWRTGPNNRYDFVLGFNSLTDWLAGFHNPDNLG